MLTSEYKYLDSKVIELINKNISNYPDFDENQFKAWIERNDIETKNNPSAFVSKCFIKELNKGTFNHIEEPEIIYVPAIQPFFNALEEKGIKVLPEDTLLIEETFTYLLNNNILTKEELTKLNHGIVEYILKQEGEHTSQEFMDLLMKSNTLKGRYIDWGTIASTAAMRNKEWNHLLEELDDGEDEQESKNYWEDDK